MLRRMTAIILGVTAVALLNALVLPHEGDELSGEKPTVVSRSEFQPERTLPDSIVFAKFEQTGTKPARDVSPLEMAEAVNNVRRRHVDVSLKDTWEALGLDPGQFEECSNDCEAKIFRHQLTSDSGPEVVLKL